MGTEANVAKPPKKRAETKKPVERKLQVNGAKLTINQHGAIEEIDNPEAFYNDGELAAFNHGLNVGAANELARSGIDTIKRHTRQMEHTEKEYRKAKNSNIAFCIIFGIAILLFTYSIFKSENKMWD